MAGWIKLHKEIKDWDWYKDANTMRLFIHLLISVNHEEGNHKGTIIKRGQVATGRSQLAYELKLSEQQIRTCLDKLKSTNDITINATKKGTIITICKYETYQDSKNQSNQQQTREHVTQVTTIEEDKEIKKKEYTPIIPKGNNPSAKVDWDKFVERWKEVTGKTIRVTDSLKKIVTARINDGFTKLDIDRVVQVKTKQWKNDPEMDKHLVPKTLFRKSNFENYINEAEELKQKPQNKKTKADGATGYYQWD